MNSNSLLPIVEQNATLNMSSREIAQLCEKEHSNVLRDIEVMFSQLEIDLGGYLHFWRHPQNRQYYREILLPKDLTLTLVAGYNVRLRKRIVDRWLELEQGQSKQVLPTTFAEALRLAADQAEQIEQQKQQLALQAPKVAFVEHYVEVGSSKSLREVAKILNIPEKMMINQLIVDRVLYRHSGNLVPYADKQGRGLFTVKTGIADHGHNFVQTRVTPKGIEWIAKRYGKEVVL